MFSVPGENRGERLGENSHKLCRGFQQSNHIAHVIFVLHSAIITHLLTNQNPRTIQIIL